MTLRGAIALAVACVLLLGAAPAQAQRLTPEQERAEVEHRAAGFFHPDMTYEELLTVIEQIFCRTTPPGAVSCKSYPPAVLKAAQEVAVHANQAYEEGGPKRLEAFLRQVRSTADAALHRARHR